MNIEKVDKYIIEILREFGWNEKRFIDISEYEFVLTNEGYNVNEYARKIMSEFAQINVNKVIKPELRSKYRGATIEFDPFYGADQDYLKIPFEDTLKEKITPIGRYYDATVFVSEKNNVYIGDTEELSFIGIGIEELLNYLFLKERKEKHIEVENWFLDIFE